MENDIFDVYNEKNSLFDVYKVALENSNLSLIGLIIVSLLIIGMVFVGIGMFNHKDNTLWSRLGTALFGLFIVTTGMFLAYFNGYIPF